MGVTVYIQDGRLKEDDILNLTKICPGIQYWGGSLVAIINYIQLIGNKKLDSIYPLEKVSYFKILPTLSEHHPVKRHYRRVDQKTGKVVLDPNGDIIYNTIKKGSSLNEQDISALCRTQASKNDAVTRFPTEGPAIEAKYILFLGELKKDQEKIKEFNNA